MTTVVLDASALLGWLLQDDGTMIRRVEEVFTQGGVQVIAPVLLRAEVANALAVAQRRKRITSAQALRAAALVDALPILFEPAAEGVSDLLMSAQMHVLSAYDSQYLMLAMHHGAQLLTADRALAAAARRAGVTV